MMNKSVRDSFCSPMPLPPPPPPPRPPSTPAGIVKMSIEEIENMNVRHKSDVQSLHESYQ